MKSKKASNTYSSSLAGHYIDSSQAIYSLSTQFEDVYHYENGKRTDEVVARRAYFVQEGLEPFYVKFPSDENVSLPPFLSIVELHELEAVEVNYNVYFRAQDVIKRSK